MTIYKNTTLFALAGLTFLFNSCSTLNHTKLSTKNTHDWQLVREDKSGGTLYTREIDNSKIRAFKVVGSINADTKTCLYWVKDKIIHNEKYENGPPAIEVLENTNRGLLTYSISKMPWPIKDREMCERYTYFQEVDKGILGIRWKEAWDENPKPINKKLTRMPIIRGKWEFFSSNGDNCKATYIAQFDPGKGMPSWMVNSMAGKFLVEEFNNIKSLSEKND